MKKDLLQFIQTPTFPCIMAKAAASMGNVVVYEATDNLSKTEMKVLLSKIYHFIASYRDNPEKLSSFIVCLPQFQISFAEYEDIFWKLLRTLQEYDQKSFHYDSRVSSDPLSPEYSFSLMEEAFFIIALHPESPRFARRFKVPAIVFNPHQQFEHLKSIGKFDIIRNVIRKRDKALQGNSNPMLQDFGTKSEIFQYFGKVYHDAFDIPFLKETA